MAVPVPFVSVISPGNIFHLRYTSQNILAVLVLICFFVLPSLINFLAGLAAFFNFLFGGCVLWQPFAAVRAATRA
jgi:hypothetical protein